MNKGVPVEWISLIKNTMVRIAPEFTMKRQIDDYFEKYYNKLWREAKNLLTTILKRQKIWLPGRRQ